MPRDKTPPDRSSQPVERRSFLLRLDPQLLDALKRWAEEDRRSLNAQIDHLLRLALDQAERGAASSEDQPYTVTAQSDTKRS